MKVRARASMSALLCVGDAKEITRKSNALLHREWLMAEIPHTHVQHSIRGSVVVDGACHQRLMAEIPHTHVQYSIRGSVVVDGACHQLLHSHNAHSRGLRATCQQAAPSLLARRTVLVLSGPLFQALGVEEVHTGQRADGVVVLEGT